MNSINAMQVEIKITILEILLITEYIYENIILSSMHLDIRILPNISKIKLHVYFKINYLHNKYFKQEIFTDSSVTICLF